MNKKIPGRMGWFYVAIGCVAISLLSMFLPIITYREGSLYFNFNVIDLVVGNNNFNYYVLEKYQGPVVWKITSEITSSLAIVAVAALVCAIVGLITLRVQRPNTKQFIITFVGLVGISIPSIIIIVIVLMYGQYYAGTLSFGAAPIVSPIALIISMGAVIRRKNKVAEELRKEVEEKGLIWKAGDL